MPEIVNISGYKFVPLTNLPNLQTELKQVCDSAELKGTILLSDEGINCFLAGSRTGIDQFLKALRARPEFSDFDAKESFNDYPPFSRMLVKIKKEIITFDMPEIRPAARPAKKIKPDELRKWLDEGKDFVLLDTRNRYEVKLGTFSKAMELPIDNFREFPQAVEQLPQQIRDKPVVMFCTGGIRCEKAGPYMEDAGFKTVLQLDGGILKYFENCGGSHWEGECFVFDKRVALDPNLSESATTMCFVCQAILSEKDQKEPQYKFGVSCPNCFIDIEPEMPDVQSIDVRNEIIQTRFTPLPGSIPYENFRPMSVSREMDGLPVLDFLMELKTHLNREQWIAHLEAGEIFHKGKPVSIDRVVMHGQKYYHQMPNTVEPDVRANFTILHEDADLVVLDKPAPLPMHPCGRFNKNSLQSFLQEVYQPDRLRLVHRLDANTTGIVIYGRSKKFATELQQLFADQKVSKRYLCGVNGVPSDSTFESNSRIAKHPGANGIRQLDPKGLEAKTEFEWIGSQPEGDRSLILAKPRTGRTNQIRLHLWDLKLPICGDPTYLVEKSLGTNQTLPIEAPPMQLHAWQIGFRHPITKKELLFEAAQPEWLENYNLKLESLGSDPLATAARGN